MLTCDMRARSKAQRRSGRSRDSAQTRKVYQMPQAMMATQMPKPMKPWSAITSK